MNSNAKFLERAVLLYGPRKAGTSLMHNLLDGGQELLMLPGELKLNAMTLMKRSLSPAEYSRAYLQKGRLDFPNLLKLENDVVTPRDDYRIEGLSKEQTEEFFDVPKYVSQLGELLKTKPEDFQQIIGHDVAAFRAALRGAARREYSCWAAKDVGGRSERVIAFHRETFPQGKIVFIAREPQFVVRSITLDRRRKGINLNFRAVWNECWKAQTLIHFLHEQKQESNAQDVFVAYEKLTADTEGEMQRVAKHLDIPFEPILCEPTTLGIPVVVRTSSHKTTQVFRPESDWRKDLNKNQSAAIAWFFKLAPLLYKRKGARYTPYAELLKHL